MTQSLAKPGRLKIQADKAIIVLLFLPLYLAFHLNLAA
jgi:hypothetical protein